MKKLCVAVAVVLSLVSVCRPAPLTCEKLMKPVDQGPDVTGTWYYIAFSAKVCLATKLINGLFWPSVSEEVTAIDKPNIYSSTVKVKIFDYCINETLFNFYEKNTITGVDTDNFRIRIARIRKHYGSPGAYVPTGDPDVLLHTSCPDCMVVKSSDVIDTLFLLSKRKAITDTELKEFEIQAQCFGWSAPEVFNTDFDYENCQDETDLFDDDDSDRLLVKVYERLQGTGHGIIRCFIEAILSYFYDLFTTYI